MGFRQENGWVWVDLGIWAMLSKVFLSGLDIKERGNKRDHKCVRETFVGFLLSCYLYIWVVFFI